MKYGIFTKPIHVEKLVNYLNQYTKLDYVISTNKYELNQFDFDIGVSYCFPHVIDVRDKSWYNYHPAPLPKYKGMTCYSDAIRDKVTEYGVTLHRMTNKVDNGKIIRIDRFTLDNIPTSTNELGCITHYFLFQLFKETICKLK